MQLEIRNALDLARQRQTIPADVMQAATDAIMRGEGGEIETAALLTALAVKGEAVEEVVGAARAMRQHCTRVTPQAIDLLDTCGTGGDALHTFNISTAVAFVVAACGVPIAKHGNRGVSSSSGSADVLEQLGVNIDLTPEQIARCIDEVGIGFCFARALHGAMKHVAPVRAALGFRTIFNLLGPLTNPAGAPRQLIGANRIESAERLAHALRQLGTQRAIVVCGNNELDEVALWGETVAFGVGPDSVQRGTWTAASFGLDECSVQDLRVESPEESAERIRHILDGAPGPSRNMVLANSAAALIAAGRATSPQEGVAAASAAIDEGRAKQLLDRLIAQSQS
ncbi:MAG: anthranilate phosphoribosyltransferase [Planctomycetaceae bacterium]|nr:anthranilate phosphoribosyltransferase [Planctomycetaceae bacterium]